MISILQKSILFFLVLLSVNENHAASASVCEPDISNTLKVVNVEKNDQLNVRTGISTEFPIVDKLDPGIKKVLFLGQVNHKSPDCLRKCEVLTSSLIKQNPILIDMITTECRLRNKIWYKIKTPNNVIGWASSKYLLEEHNGKERFANEESEAVMEKIKNTALTVEFENGNIEVLSGAKYQQKLDAMARLELKITELVDYKKKLENNIEELASTKEVKLKETAHLNEQISEQLTYIKKLETETHKGPIPSSEANEFASEKNTQSVKSLDLEKALGLRLNETGRGSIETVFKWVNACNSLQKPAESTIDLAKYILEKSPIKKSFGSPDVSQLEPTSTLKKKKYGLNIFPNAGNIDEILTFLKSYKNSDQILCHFYIRGILIGLQSYNEMLFELK